MIPLFLKKYIKKIEAALILEDIISHPHRRKLVSVLGVFSVFFFCIYLFNEGDVALKARGAFLMIFALWAIFFMLESFFYSAYVDSHNHEEVVPFEIGEVVYYAEDDDLTKGLLFSDIGDRTMKRLGILEKDIKEFLKEKRAVSHEEVSHLVGPLTTIENFAKAVYDFDSDFKDFLFKKGFNFKEFVGSLLFVVNENRRKISRERWWSRENLLRVPGIGKNWSYGQTFTLEKYGRDITLENSSLDESYGNMLIGNVRKLEEILAKNSGANAVVTSDDEASRLDIVNMTAKLISQGKSLPILSHKRIYVLNPNLIIESTGDKVTFEREFVSILIESMKAQNVIIVFPEFVTFMESAKVLGVDILGVLRPYLESKLINIIILESKLTFNTRLQNVESVMGHFEHLPVSGKDPIGALEMLTGEVKKIEKSTKVFITFPAILAISDSAERYFESYSFASKARDLLIESIPFCLSRGKKIVTREDILELVEGKTGIPLSKPEGQEKKMLLNLESILHERVVGQDEAIKSISSAMRRGRAGIRNPDRPIGSFLFLGPTGVGKTETTKALASIFFGNEDQILRLDMSEFRGADALMRLIGSISEERPGVLATLLRERPYGVLLLDEFEKTTDDVRNLFLQILDEGYFTDAKGRKVNARNNIIIATSNAGSDLIWKLEKEGVSLKDSKDKVIEHIIENGIYKPELLNRFDSVILFHPLAEDHLRKIARLMLEKLIVRIREKGIELVPDENIIDFLIKVGIDPEFGARPMIRAIQEQIEEIVAIKIIEGELKEGGKARLVVENDSVTLKAL